MPTLRLDHVKKDSARRESARTDHSSAAVSNPLLSVWARLPPPVRVDRTLAVSSEVPNAQTGGLKRRSRRLAISMEIIVSQSVATRDQSSLQPIRTAT